MPKFYHKDHFMLINIYRLWRCLWTSFILLHNSTNYFAKLLILSYSWRS